MIEPSYKPVYLRLREFILTSAKIAVDKTVAPIPAAAAPSRDTSGRSLATIVSGEGP